jgi:hypothetical protein
MRSEFNKITMTPIIIEATARSFYKNVATHRNVDSLTANLYALRVMQR